MPVLYPNVAALLQIEPDSLFKFFRRKAVRFSADPVVDQHPPAKADLLAYPFTELSAQILSAQSEIPPALKALNRIESTSSFRMLTSILATNFITLSFSSD